MSWLALHLATKKRLPPSIGGLPWYTFDTLFGLRFGCGDYLVDSYYLSESGGEIALPSSIPELLQSH